VRSTTTGLRRAGGAAASASRRRSPRRPFNHYDQSGGSTWSTSPILPDAPDGEAGRRPGTTRTPRQRQRLLLRRRQRQRDRRLGPCSDRGCTPGCYSRGVDAVSPAA
jgi:hypothetical protein